MTLASAETYRGWAEPDKQRIQKQILDLFPTWSRLHYHHVGMMIERGHGTTTARMQELSDMSLIEVIGTVKRGPKSKRSTVSKFALSDLGKWLMAHEKRDEILADMNRERRELEQERADAMRQIRREHVAAVRIAAHQVKGRYDGEH